MAFFELDRVDRLEDDHFGNAAQHADVLHAHVGAAVEFGADAGSVPTILTFCLA